MRSRNYTDNDFTNAVQSSKSIREALSKLGLKPAGGNYKIFKDRVEKLNLDISHFTGHGSNKGKEFGPRRPIEDYLSNNQYIQPYKLKRRLLKDGLFKYECSQCELTEWLSQPIPLELHHINGDNKDNRLENITLLCPNCHATTPNYRGRNMKK